MEPELGEYQPPKVEILKSGEKLPEARAGALFAAVGNHEGKALLETAMRPRDTYDRPGIHKLWKEIQQGHEGWIGNPTLQFAWCDLSLAPIGLVTKRIIDRPTGQTIGFEKTQLGFDQGDPLAGHLLHASLKDPNGSLYNYYGSTAVPGRIITPLDTNTDAPEKNRAPLTRHRIFSELATIDKPIRVEDILVSLYERYPQEYPTLKNGIKGRGGSLDGHLSHLAEHGLIQREARDANMPYVVYQHATESPQTFPSPAGGYVTITRQVYELFQRFPHEEWTHERMAAMLKQEYGKGYRKPIIASTLSHLRREGYIQKGEFGMDLQSKISVTPQQQERLINLVTIFDRFVEQDQDFLEEGREKARKIVSNSEAVALLAKKAQNASPNANKTDKADTIARIEAIIATNPGCTTKDIRRELKSIYQQNITGKTINSRTRELSEIGGLTVKDRGSQHHYFLERRLTGEETELFSQKKK